VSPKLPKSAGVMLESKVAGLFAGSVVIRWRRSFPLPGELY
jgi:hypothetical protein